MYKYCIYIYIWYDRIVIIMWFDHPDVGSFMTQRNIASAPLPPLSDYLFQPPVRCHAQERYEYPRERLNCERWIVQVCGNLHVDIIGLELWKNTYRSYSFGIFWACFELGLGCTWVYIFSYGGYWVIQNTGTPIDDHALDGYFFCEMYNWYQLDK